MSRRPVVDDIDAVDVDGTLKFLIEAVDVDSAVKFFIEDIKLDSKNIPPIAVRSR